MIYIYDELNFLDDKFLEQNEKRLSRERNAKIKRLKTYQNKLQSATVYLLLRYALHCEYDINEAVVFNYSDKGKPLLKDYPHIHFSLSHCKSAVSCALSDKEIGVDIQDVRPVTSRLANRVLTEDEFKQFINSKSPNEYFCKVWTIKEAYLKKTGQGIGAALFEVETNNIKDITIFQEKNYYCCATEISMEVQKIGKGAL